MAEPVPSPAPALPAEIPIFPLPGALLLPRARLPLNIFEARYLAMIEDVLASGRMMGMVQTTEAYDDGLVPEGAEVFGVGCLGRLSSFTETDDGRFVITLAGLCRFRLEREVEGRNGYRRWQVDYTPYLSDTGRDDSALVDRAGLLATVKAYFEAKALRVDWTAIEKAPDEAVATTLAMACPLYEPRDKQALLESANTAARGRTLRVLLEMALHGTAASGGANH